MTFAFTTPFKIPKVFSKDFFFQQGVQLFIHMNYIFIEMYSLMCVYIAKYNERQ